MPQHCSGFSEVLYALGAGMNRLDVARMADYAVRLNAATAERFGLGARAPRLRVPRGRAAVPLPVKGYRKLDPTGRYSGSCNSRWMLWENLPGMVEP